MVDRQDILAHHFDWRFILLRKILKEPLVHFLFMGLALFVLYQLFSPDAGNNRKITISDATVAMISQRYASVWQRPPTPDELKGLVDTYIREEILYREGVAIGLDRDDAVIKRRVLQKLEVLSEETGTLNPPSDAELTAYLNAHAAEYAKQPVIGFQQVLFDPVRHGANLEADFNTALAKLQAGANPEALGDSSLLPAKQEAIAADMLARDFGDEFAKALLSLPVGSWQGPVRSGFGVHIVRVNSRTPGQASALSEVRAAVQRDWENQRRNKTREAYYQDLRRNYDVEIEAALPDVPHGQAQR